MPKPHALTIESDQLAPPAREELQRLLQTTDFFQRPGQTSAPQHVYDGFTYTITVEDGERSHQIRTFDPLPDQEIAALIQFIQEHGKAL